MTHRPAALTPAQLRDAARAAVGTAVKERTVALSEQESRDTSGGATLPSGPTGPVGPIVAGGIYEPSPVGVVA